ncbi:UNVERIFIED_CONTAM: hypothetical protein NCL1_33597 [Trichonephila clavipes]
MNKIFFIISPFTFRTYVVFLFELRQISTQIKGYEDFRLFFLSLNLAFLPLLLAAGICYGMRDLITSEAAKMALQSFVMFLIFISGTIGIPMYLGAVWAMYSFSLPKGAYVENFVRTLEEYREANESVPNSEIRPLDSSASIGLESESESQEHFMIES